MEPSAPLYQARILADKLRLTPEVARRLVPTEKLWQYRNYNGGDPASMIDWKQSARTAVPVVREHEPIQTKSTYFWTDLSALTKEIQDKASLIIGTMAYLLVYKEREVGWLTPHLLKTHLTNDVELFLKRVLSTPQSDLVYHPIQNSFLIFVADFSTFNKEFHAMIRSYIAYRNEILLIHLGDEPVHPQLKVPSLTLSKTGEPEPFILSLLEKVLQDTR